MPSRIKVEIASERPLFFDARDSSSPAAEGTILHLTPEHNGVLPAQWIRAAIEDNAISADSKIDSGQVQPNSLDLRIGSIGYRIQCSFLPGDEGLKSKLAKYRWYDMCLQQDGLVLERNQTYIFPLMESLQLPADVSARANPKSSTGRLDVFTRLVTEHGRAFDEVRAGYEGKLYLEVVPRSFAIHIRPGDSLSQIRFQMGSPQLSYDDTVELLDNDEIILGPDLKVLRAADLSISSGIILSVSLPRNQKVVGYQARKNTPPIDLRALGKIEIEAHWDAIPGDNKPVILEPDDFYIFASRELVRLPPKYCAEMVPFDAGSGELRTHYAGFFDSGFGFTAGQPAWSSAAAVVLEIRNRDVPFLIEDGQPLFRLNMMRSAGEPDKLYGSGLGSNYQSQRLRLGKQFASPD